MKKIFVVLLSLSLLSGCKWMSSLWDYYSKTQDFTTALNAKDYQKCMSLIDVKLMEENDIPRDTILAKMQMVNAVVEKNWGAVKYSLPNVSDNISWSSEKGSKETFPLATVSFDNGKEYGIMDIKFDRKSKMIRSFFIRDIKNPIPDETLFWVFMVIGIFEFCFIVYVLRMVKQSDSAHKKRKYALAILLNVPTIVYSTMSGISLNLFTVEFLFGSGFSREGYINATWELGIPLGALYVIYKLRKEKKEADDIYEAEMQAHAEAEEEKRLAEEKALSGSTPEMPDAEVV